MDDSGSAFGAMVFLLFLAVFLLSILGSGGSHHHNHIRPAPNGAYFKGRVAYTEDGFRLSEAP